MKPVFSLFLLSLLIICLLSGCGGGGKVDSTAPESEKIIFDDGWDLCKIDVDGKNLIKLNVGGGWAPRFTHDGSKVVFCSYRDGEPDVYMMNRDGSNIVRLTNSHDSEDVIDISPDGTMLAYVGSYEFPEGSIDRRIYLMDIADGSRTMLTTGGNDNDPCFSQDGHKVLYSGRLAGYRQIFSINIDGTGCTALTDVNADNRHPVFSPDGTKIAFTSSRDANSQIYIMDANGLNETRVTMQQNANCDFPSFSPDGKKIAFEFCPESSQWQIWIINLDGTGLTQVTTEGGRQPTWGPAIMR